MSCRLSVSTRQLLQVPGNTTTSHQTIQGRLTVAEPGTYYPNPTADAARGDKEAWLDDSGSISIVGADQVPAELLPQWKKGGWGVKWVIPVWVWIAGAGGVLLLCVVGVGVWAVVAARRRKHEEQLEQAGRVQHLGLQPVIPGQDPEVWASRVTTPRGRSVAGDKGWAQHSNSSSPRPLPSPRTNLSPKAFPSSPRGAAARQHHSFSDGPDPHRRHHQQQHPSQLRTGSVDSPRRSNPRAAPWSSTPAADVWENEPQEPPWERGRY
jgi:hypothetical protein